MTMHRLIIISLLFLSFGFPPAQAQSTKAFFTEVNTFLGTYVSKGKVAYKALHKDPTALHALLEKAKTIRVATSDKKTYQAFWINAYNLAVIKGIIDHYPISSPLDHKGFFDTDTYMLGGVKISLNDIENKKLRAQFNDARIHFVLVCGAQGCPPLLSEAYLPNTLEAQLEAQTKKALNNPNFIKVSDKTVAFSEIFKWYKEDFVKNGNNEIDFLNQYRQQKIAKNLSITYYPYNWQLNTQ